MHLLLVTGFLGSGKTTLILELARRARQSGRKVAIVVNEIGEIGIDNQVMRQLDLNVWELLSGCICCTLAADLVSTLQQLDRDYKPDLVVVEPSGAADAGNLLKTLPYYKGAPLESTRTAVVLDPLRLPMLLEVLTPLITHGIRLADLLIISKSDVASAGEMGAAAAAAREINPEAPLFCVALNQAPEEALVRELLPWPS